MAVHRLTDRWLSNCPPPQCGRLEFADGLCPGLRARITSKGKKSFSVVRWTNGRQQRVTIGQYPSFSLADACARAREVLLGTGGASADPQHTKAPAAQALTYAEMADQYVQ